MSKTNVLLIGATGFAGSEVLNVLLESPDKFSVTAVLHKKELGAGNTNLNILHSDFRDLNEESLKKINPDIVFHLARINSTRFRGIGRYMAARRGKSANKKLLGHLNNIGKPVKLVYLSGSLMYGNGLKNELSPLNPISFARQYHIAEKPFLENKRYPNVSIKLVRVPWLLGFGSWFKVFYHDPARKFQTVPMYSDDKLHMMFLDINDCARNLVHIAESDFSGVHNLFMPGSVSYKMFTDLMSEYYQMKREPYIPEKIKDKFEKAVVEAFTSEVLMDTVNVSLQKELSFRFKDQETMLKANLLSFSKHK